MNSVECGDYHFGALTSSGELYTFGGFSNGALGHGVDNERLSVEQQGPSRAVEIPSRVTFVDPFRPDLEPKSQEYCFNFAMAGWQSSALTVDLRAGEGLDEDDDYDEKRDKNQASGPYLMK